VVVVVVVEEEGGPLQLMSVVLAGGLLLSRVQGKGFRVEEEEGRGRSASSPS
jgi:hypothetical protein